MRDPRPWLAERVRRHRRGLMWTGGVIGVVLLLAFVIAFMLDEPLRRIVEKQMNAKMKGYTATIGKLDFHPIGFSVDFYDVLFVQDTNPDPPVLKMERLSASVQWWALLHARLVADFKLIRPTIYMDRSHFETEMKDPTPVEEHGWQDAIQAMYPLKINEFKVVDGDVTYVETPKAKPLHLSDIQASVHDVRNVRSKEGEYPSPLMLKAKIFDRGRIVVDGKADFLAEPVASVKGHIELTDISLDYFTPIAARYNLVISRGAVSGKGDVEYSPKIKTVYLESLRVDNLHAEYAYKKAEAAVAGKVVQKTAEAAADTKNASDLVLHIEDVRLVNSNFAFINRSANPQYRVTLTDTNATLTKFSNQKSDGYGHAKLTGRFMGSGATTVDATFNPETKGPDFLVNAKIENTDMREMNDLLRAHGKFDVVSGVFSLYTELAVKNGHVNGYVKPLFRDLKAYSKEQDEDKTFGEKVKEKVIDVAGKVLKNRPRREVATVANVAGPVADPKANTWEVLVKLIQNAFIKAILPGFDREIEASNRHS
jgi:uncharacterized protein DUF748